MAPTIRVSRTLRDRGWRQGIALGIVLTVFQVGLACSQVAELQLSGASFTDAYARLCNWDCAWYAEIARDGYHSTIPPVRQSSAQANVAFFPMYPAFGRALYLGAGVDPHMGLLLIAQFFSIVFWASLWVLLVQWGVRKSQRMLVTLIVLAHPASFFLISGYSESLFLGSLLLFLVQASRGDRWIAASASGAMMSATRLVGVPAAAYPLFFQAARLLSARRLPNWKVVTRSAAICFLASSGAGLFFLYCQFRFGRFDLYFETQKIGWGIVPDYGVLWNWKAFRFSYPIDRVATVISGAAFALTAVSEVALAFKLGRRTGLARRAPVYIAAFLMFWVTLSGLKSVQFRSMVRYSLAWSVLLALAYAHLLARSPRLSVSIRFVGGISVLVVLAASVVWVQLPHLRDFLKGIWFA